MIYLKTLWQMWKNSRLISGQSREIYDRQARLVKRARKNGYSNAEILRALKMRDIRRLAIMGAKRGCE